jgi:hypothetical protein
MASPATRWDGPAETEPARTLRVAGDRERRIAEFREKVRAAGEQWTGTCPSGLSELLCAAADDDPELVRLARAGGRLLEDFVEGLTRGLEVATSGDLVADLVDGKRVQHDGLAAAYVVLLARFVAERYDGPSQDLARSGVLWTRRSGVFVLLVPDGDTALLDRVTGELTAARGWVATARRQVTELADAYAEACEVLRLVLAGCRAPGAYAMTDVLLEHAILGNELVTARLAEMIRPLRENAVLWETLVAFVRADFNRNTAARDLFIHRSTMDYRLQRIAKATGCDPVTGRGAQLLSAALIADAVA